MYYLARGRPGPRRDVRRHRRRSGIAWPRFPRSCGSMRDDSDGPGQPARVRSHRSEGPEHPECIVRPQPFRGSSIHPQVVHKSGVLQSTAPPGPLPARRQGRTGRRRTSRRSQPPRPGPRQHNRHRDGLDQAPDGFAFHGNSVGERTGVKGQLEAGSETGHQEEGDAQGDGIPPGNRAGNGSAANVTARMSTTMADATTTQGERLTRAARQPSDSLICPSPGGDRDRRDASRRASGRTASRGVALELHQRPPEVIERDDAHAGAGRFGTRRPSSRIKR